MAVGIYANSQDELSSCLPIACHIAKSFGDLLIVFVPGKEDALLAKTIRAKIKSLDDEGEKPSPRIRLKALGEEDIQAKLLKEVKPLEKLLLIHSEKQKKEQAELADKAPCTTIRLFASEDNTGCDRVCVARGDYTHGSARRAAQRIADRSGSGLLLAPFKTPPEYGTSDLVFIGTAYDGSRDAEDVEAAEALRSETETPPAVGVVLTGHSKSRRGYAAFENFVQRWVPQMQRETRKKLTESLHVFVAKEDKDKRSVGQALREERFDFVAMIGASTALASLGLVQDSAAVIIGAMLVAPLMSPILAGSLAVVHSHRKLFKEAWKMILLGFAFAFALSFIIGLVYPGFSTVFITRQIASRCRPSLMDFLIGFAGGGAAAYARTRDELSSALAGAAIAAALVPPIASAGLNLAFFFHGVSRAADVTPLAHPILAPLLLFGVNVFSIMLAGAMSLWAAGVRSYNQKNSEHGGWQTRAIALLVLLAIGSVTVTYLIDVDAPARKEERLNERKEAFEKSEAETEAALDATSDGDTGTEPNTPAADDDGVPPGTSDTPPAKPDEP